MNEAQEIIEREGMEVDVVIVGGPAGLATACRLMQLAAGKEHELSVVVLEKAAAVGDHILSGAVIGFTALNELFPDWAERGAPLNTPVPRDEIYFFTGPDKAVKIPNALAPRTMHNRGNYIVSLGQVVRWLGEHAEALGVEIYPGFRQVKYSLMTKAQLRGLPQERWAGAKMGHLNRPTSPAWNCTPNTRSSRRAVVGIWANN